MVVVAYDAHYKRKEVLRFMRYIYGNQTPPCLYSEEGAEGIADDKMDHEDYTELVPFTREDNVSQTILMSE